MAVTGRPSEYEDSYVLQVSDYLATRKDEFENGKVKVKLPTIEGFSVFLGVSVKSLYNWAEQHEDFLQALELIKKEQQERLLNNGLSGDYNSTIAKLVLSSNHGMREKSDVTTNDKEIGGLRELDESTLRNIADGSKS